MSIRTMSGRFYDDSEMQASMPTPRSASSTLIRCKRANWKLGLRNALHFSVSRGVIQRKERGPAKWQLAAYNHVHNKRMADGDWPTSTVNPQRYLQTQPSGTGSLEQYKIRPTC